MLTLPLAWAGADVNGGAARVVVADSHSNCEPAPFEACLVEVDSDGSVGRTNIDARQRIEYVGIAADVVVVEGLIGVNLLPDGSLMVRGSQLFVRHPIFVLAAAIANDQTNEGPTSGVASTRWTSENLTIVYFGPSTANPTAPPGSREYEITHNSSGLGYDQQGPHNAPGMNSTDGYLAGADAVCTRAPDPAACDGALEDGLATIADATPNAELALEFYDAEVASDPEALRSQNTSYEPLANDSPLRGGPVLEPAPNQSTGPSRASGEDTEKPSLVVGRPAQVEPLREPGRGPRIEMPSPADPPPPTPIVALAVATATVFVLLLAAALYSRLARADEVVRLPMRKMLIRVVEDRPGIEIRALPARLGVARSTVLYHLRMLEKHGLLRVLRDGHKRFVFPAASTPPTSGRPLRFWSHPVSRRILEIIDKAGPNGTTRGQIHIEAAAIPRRTRNHVLTQLQSAGVVAETTQDDGQSRLTIRSQAPDTLAASL